MISDPRKFANDALARERDERIQERRRAEADARALLEAAAGEMVEEQARELFRYLNRDFGNGRPIAGRFSPAFVGHYVDVLLSDLAAFNGWTGRIWRAAEDEALQAVGQILDHRALLRGAGSSYPTMLMYLRDQRRWAVWGPVTDRGLRKIVDSDHRRPAHGHLADYLAFAGAATGLIDQLEIAPEEVDFVLAAAARWTLQAESPDGALSGTRRRTWWVNQGQTYQAERDGSYLWAPAVSKTGAPLAHHASVMDLEPGDVVIHYAGRVRALGEVTARSQHAPRPSEPPSEPWSDDGLKGSVAYHELERPIELSEIPSAWRTPALGPFDRNGGVKQVYLEPVADEFAEHFFSRFADRLPELVTGAKHVWLFQANPRYYDLAAHLANSNVGDQDSFGVNRYGDTMQPGDIAVLYQSGPEAGVYGTAVLTSSLIDEYEPEWESEEHPSHTEGVEFRLTRILETPITRQELLSHPVLQRMQVIRAPQGTNFRVEPEEWQALSALVETTTPATTSAALPAELEELHRELTRKRQVILQGPPGVGKTYVARRYLDWLANGDPDPYRLGAYLRRIGDRATPDAVARIVADQTTPLIWDIVQFHPSYTYEDFIRGLVPRPVEGGVTFETQNKVGGWLAAVATVLEAQDVNATAVLVIDEINRGDISKIFGELIYGLEYRDQPVASPYAIDGSNEVVIPRILLLIGTMNTADRSIALVDYALRRRFVFLDVRPSRNVIETHPQFAGELDRHAALWLYDVVTELFVERDLHDLQVGHSYFLPEEKPPTPQAGCDLLASRFGYEVYPLLLEYQSEGRFESGQLDELLTTLGFEIDAYPPQRDIANAVAHQLKQSPWLQS